MITEERAIEILEEVFVDPIVRPDDARHLRVMFYGGSARFVWFAPDGSIEDVLEQPMTVLPLGEVDERRYRTYAEGARAAIERRVETKPAEMLLPADFLRPNVILDPDLVTAADVADVLLDVDRLARIVGPVEMGRYLAQRGLAPVEAGAAAFLWQLLHDDFDVARAGAVGLGVSRDPAVHAALLAVLEGWAGFFEAPEWWTADGENVHRVLAGIVSRNLRQTVGPDSARRLQALGLAD